MTVVCDACKTSNRDSAMFCRGCTRKLPAFAATGPSALAMQPPARRTLPRATAASLQTGLPGIWLAVGFMLVAAAIALTAWYAYVSRRPATGPAPVATAAPAPRSVPTLPLTLLTPISPAPAESTEPASVVASAPPALAAEPERPAQASPIPVAPVRRPIRAANAAASPAGDPRGACVHLNFIAAARCEAAQCDKAAYARHPRCAVVREDRRRDEARRNLSY